MAKLVEIKTREEAEARIAGLQSMSVAGLRRQWVLLFGNHPYTTRNKMFLIKRLTWRIKTLLNGGLSERAMKRAEEIADETLIRMRPREHRVEAAKVVQSELPPDTPAADLPPGTVIARKYKGTTYEVTVLKDRRFVYDGEVYDNLTAIAWKICGYQKSGNLFFNLPMTPRKNTHETETK